MVWWLPYPARIMSKIASAIVPTVIGFVTGGPGGAAMAFASSVAMSVVGSALAPKPKQASLPSFAAEAQGFTALVRQAITSHKLIVGETRVSGALTFWEQTGDGQHWHVVVTLAAHEVAAIGTVWLDEKPVYDDQLDGSGNVTAGPFAGKLRIKKHLGAADQVADPDLVAETSRDFTFRGRGRAYLYLRMADIRTTFSGRIPNVTADLKGAPLEDPRGTGAAYWSPNPALGLAWYLMHGTYGLGLSMADLDVPALAAAADECDEAVAVVPQGHLAAAVSAAADTLDLATAESSPHIRLQTGDTVRVAWVGEMPGGLAAATDYYVILKRPQGYFTAAKSLLVPGSPSFAGDFVAAFDAGRVDAWQAAAADFNPRIQLASSYTNAIAGVAVDITSAGSGTGMVLKTAEPRYAMGGVVDTERSRRDVVTQMLTCFAGRLIFAGGVWRILAGSYTAPTVTLDEDDLHGGLQVLTKLSRNERFNAVKGVYRSPVNADQASDYPAVVDQAFVTADNGETIYLDHDLPFTRRPQAAQRLARILLREHRQQITVKARWTLAAFQVQAGDTVAITNTRFGWSAKAFLVDALHFGADQDEKGGPILVVDLLLRETASTIYDFDAAADETTVDPAPNTTLPNALDVGEPTNLTLESGSDTLFLKDDGTVVSRIKWTFSGADDFFVEQYEVHVKKAAEANWTVLAPINAEPGSPNTYFGFIWDVEDGTAYDVRVRAFNGIAFSDWVEPAGSPTAHTVVGKTAPPEDVTSLTVQQNGNVCTFLWSAVSDVDLAGYELRYMAAPFAWDDATVITAITKGTLVTNAALPPGSWTVGIKAVDTSGNFSAAAETFAIVVSNENNVVATSSGHPDFLYGRTDMIRHDVSGRLVPRSTRAASASGTFAKMVNDPVADAYYETAPIDLGVDADGVRVWASVTSGVGPGHAGGMGYGLEIDHRDQAGAFDGFEPWGIGSLDGRHIKGRAHIATAGDNVHWLSAFTLTADAPDRTESGTVTLGVGSPSEPFFPMRRALTNTGFTVDGYTAAGALLDSEAVVFAQPFIDPPAVQLTPDVNTGEVDWSATGV